MGKTYLIMGRDGTTTDTHWTVSTTLCRTITY
uniref:Uncharacterized protein n=1 Tax=Anguilla anguilla TaxID=7936 RepID=A0A0E9UXL8_ANGAN